MSAVRNGTVSVRFGDRVHAVAAVAFDKDGTLLASGPFWQEINRPPAGSHGCHPAAAGGPGPDSPVKAGLPADTWDFLVTPADVARGKPEPDMVNLVCHRLAIPPGAVAVVGDAAVDLQMARAAGALAVAVPEVPEERPVLAPLADVVLASPAEVEVAP